MSNQYLAPETRYDPYRTDLFTKVNVEKITGLFKEIISKLLKMIAIFSNARLKYKSFKQIKKELRLPLQYFIDIPLIGVVGFNLIDHENSKLSVLSIESRFHPVIE